MKSIIAIGVLIIGVLLTACSFDEYAQSAKLSETIDSHRTGCEIDKASLTTGWLSYKQNKLHFYGATPTPRPVTSDEQEVANWLEQVWEHGCQTGRRVGSSSSYKQATLASLRDQLDILDARLTALEPTPTPTATATPTSD